MTVPTADDPLVIPSATIQRVAAQLESHGRVARGYLVLVSSRRDSRTEVLEQW